MDDVGYNTMCHHGWLCVNKKIERMITAALATGPVSIFLYQIAYGYSSAYLWGLKDRRSTGLEGPPYDSADCANQFAVTANATSEEIKLKR
jgi:hypothetical protein